MTAKKKQVEKVAQGLGANPKSPKLPPMQDTPDPEEPNEKSWTLTIGVYPGILFGIRTYEEEDFKTHVLYLPFIDFALEIDN